MALATQGRRAGRGVNVGRPAFLAETLVLAIAAAATWSLPRLPQPQAYHAFAGDERALLFVPHGGANVVSNLAIAVPGLCGLWVLALLFFPRQHPSHSSSRSSRGAAEGSRRTRPMRAPDAPSAEEAVCLAISYAGLVGISIGSAIYHSNPNNETLVLDRLGIAVSFPSLLAAQIAERRSRVGGLLALPLFVGAAVGTVLHWAASEAAGRGDLRTYMLMQALSLFGSVYHVVAYAPLPPRRSNRKGRYLAATGLYAAAMAVEALDWQIYRLTGGLVSGHTIKHVLAGQSCWQLVRELRRRCRSGRTD